MRGKRARLTRREQRLIAIAKLSAGWLQQMADYHGAAKLKVDGDGRSRYDFDKWVYSQLYSAERSALDIKKWLDSALADYAPKRKKAAK